ncbi:MAG: class II aldolase/adducin family protein, partial [Planctomycetota bacterium]
DKTNVIILANHGTVSYGESVEQAYWWTEILDSYCRMLLLAKQLGNVEYLSQGKSQELLDLKDKWGFKDPRNTSDYEDCDICANDIFRHSWADAGVQRRAFAAPPTAGSGADATTGGQNSTGPGGSDPGGVDEEALVAAITNEVMRQLQNS